MKLAKKLYKTNGELETQLHDEKEKAVKLNVDLAKSERAISDLKEELRKSENAGKLVTAQMEHDFHTERQSREAELNAIAHQFTGDLKKAKQDMYKARDKYTSLQKKAKERFASIQKQAREKIAAQERQAVEKLGIQEKEAKDKIAALEEKAKGLVIFLTKQAEDKLATVEIQAQEKLDAQEQQAKDNITAVKDQTEEKIKALEKKLASRKEKIDDLRTKLKVQQKQQSDVHDNSIANLKRTHAAQMKDQKEHYELLLKGRKMSSRVRRVFTSCFRRSNSAVGVVCCNNRAQSA